MFCGESISAKICRTCVTSISSRIPSFILFIQHCMIGYFSMKLLTNISIWKLFKLIWKGIKGNYWYFNKMLYLSLITKIQTIDWTAWSTHSILSKTLNTKKKKILVVSKSFWCLIVMMKLGENVLMCFRGQFETKRW